MVQYIETRGARSLGADKNGCLCLDTWVGPTLESSHHSLLAVFHCLAFETRVGNGFL